MTSPSPSPEEASPEGSPEPVSPPQAASSFALQVALWVCLAVGCGVTLLLAAKHLQAAGGAEIGLPGCSSGGKFDCDRVLSSAYGKIGGISVTYFALGYYLLAALAMGVAGFAARQERAPALALFTPLIVGTLGLVTAAWSMYVMTVELKSLCLYCLVVHAANTAFFFLAGPYSIGLFQARRQKTLAAGQIPSLAPIIVAAMVALTAWQWIFLSAFHDPVVLEVVVSKGVLINELRIGGLADGAEPIWTVEPDNSTKPGVVVMFSCFTCPNCKETHKLLNEILAEHPGGFRIDLRMNPLAAPCNPYMKGGVPTPAHANACQLAKIAVAVAAVDPARFPEFATWLYSKQADYPSHTGILPYEAEDEAARRVDPVKLKEALSAETPLGQRVAARVALDMELSLKYQVPSVPQVYVGRTGADSEPTSNQPSGQLSGELNAGKLRRILAQEFGWQAHP